MPKYIRHSITFDSELEADYYDHIYSNEDVKNFRYHPTHPIPITKGNTYTPDFVVEYADHFEIIETKGYNPYSKMKDDMIHNIMLTKTLEEFRAWMLINGIDAGTKDIIYRKIKHLNAFGFVDWDFKNPNTIANKRKAKINEQQSEIKILKEFKKDADRFFKYHVLLLSGHKLNKTQLEWYKAYENKLKEVLE